MLPKSKTAGIPQHLAGREASIINKGESGVWDFEFPGPGLSGLGLPLQLSVDDLGTTDKSRPLNRYY